MSEKKVKIFFLSAYCAENQDQEYIVPVAGGDNFKMKLLAYYVKHILANGASPWTGQDDMDIERQVFSKNALNTSSRLPNLRKELYKFVGINQNRRGDETSFLLALNNQEHTETDVRVFKTLADAFTLGVKTPLEAQAFVTQAASLVSNSLLPMEWQEDWVLSWREEIDQLYAQALKKAFAVYWTDNIPKAPHKYAEGLEQTKSLFSRIQKYVESKEGSTKLSKAFPQTSRNASEILDSIGKTEYRRYKGTPNIALDTIDLVRQDEIVPVQESRQASVGLSTETRIAYTPEERKQVILMGVVALFHGAKFGEIQQMYYSLATRLDDRLGLECNLYQEGLIILKEEEGETGFRVLLGETQNRQACIEAFWWNVKDDREKVWVWITSASKHIDTVPHDFLYGIKYLFCYCPEGVEMGVLRVWLESPMPSPLSIKTQDTDKLKALRVLAYAYKEEERLRGKIEEILDKWCNTDKRYLQQVSAVLCGAVLVKYASGAEKGLKMLEALMQAEDQNLVGHIGEALCRFLDDTPTSTLNILKILDSYRKSPVGIGVFLTLMSYRQSEKEAHLLLQHALTEQKIRDYCQELFALAILDNKYSQIAWNQFGRWYEVSKQAEEKGYLKVVKQMYRQGDNLAGKPIQRRLKHYIELYEPKAIELIEELQRS